MTTCPSPINHSPKLKRRTLRSNYNSFLHNNNTNATHNNDKIVNQIKFQIEHEMTNNATKTSFPVQEDVKASESIVPAFESSLVSVHNVLHQICHFQNVCSHMAAHNSVANILSRSEILPEEKLQYFDEFPKKQAFLDTPPTKSSSKTFKLAEISPYDQKRRSYRKIKKQTIKCVPFRKCQDQFEHRIVSLINKISQNKHNTKEVEIFCDKLTKISLKDLYNPYVVSGVHTISKLLQEKSLQPLQPSVDSVIRLRNEVKGLSERIWQEIGNIQDYEHAIDVKKLVNIDITRDKMVRKIYKMLIRQRKYEPTMARMKSFEVCDSFFTQCNHQTSQEDVIDFLKQQHFLSI